MDELRVLPDYDCFPLWLRSSDGYSNDDPASFGLSQALGDALLAWADEYDATLNRDDPASSGFKTQADLDAFVASGRELATQVAREVAGRYTVTYFDAATNEDEPITAD
jgi:hypothetical protein